jgi:Transglycosylase SLT domain
MKKALVTALLSMALLTAVPSHRVEAARSGVSLTPSQVWSVHAIAWASRRWNVNYWWLYNVAWCESRLDYRAYNRYSGAEGLFQFMPGTYWAYAWRIGEQRSPYDAYAAANVAAYMFSRGQAYQWACNY